MSGVGAVVVHHRSLNTLTSTITSLTESGLRPDSVVVVDNSGEACSTDELLLALPVEAILVRTPNSGYAAAVNRGVMELRAHYPDVEHILVATHETLIDEQSLGALGAALDADQALAAVGPVLWTPRGELWSAGGRLTHVLRLPRHVLQTDPFADETVRIVPWLDGALVLYRAAAISQRPMDERFFLYMEEVDYHQRLRLDGWNVAVCHAARASQDSKGMPAFYAARNMWLFQSKWGRRGFRRLAVAYVALRAASGALRRRDSAQLMATYKGFWAGRKWMR